MTNMIYIMSQTEYNINLSIIPIFIGISTHCNFLTYILQRINVDEENCFLCYAESSLIFCYDLPIKFDENERHILSTTPFYIKIQFQSQG